MDNTNPLFDQAQECAAKEYAYQQQYAAGAIAGGNLARGPERSYPSFALEAAAAVATVLDQFYPGGPEATCSRLLTRAEKLAALRAAIAVYEHLNW